MTAMVLVLATSGCGSDGKGGSTPVPVTTGSTPAPTPSPAPSPSQTPVARTYDVAPDFTHDRSFTGYDRADITFENRKVRTVALSSSDTGVTTFTQQGGKEIAILMKTDLGDGRSDIDLLTGRLQ